MIGKNTPWSGNSAGEYADGSYSDTNVPIPLDTGVAPFIHHDARIAAKLIPQTDVSHVLKRIDWTTGTVYPEYNHFIVYSIPFVEGILFLIRLSTSKASLNERANPL